MMGIIKHDKKLTIVFEFENIRDEMAFVMDLEKAGYKMKKGILVKEDD